MLEYLKYAECVKYEYRNEKKNNKKKKKNNNKRNTKTFWNFEFKFEKISEIQKWNLRQI